MTNENSELAQARTQLNQAISDIEYIHKLLERRWPQPLSTIELTVLGKLFEISQLLRTLVKDDIRRLEE